MLRVIFAARRKTGVLDLEAIEQATRAALHQAGARLLETLLNEDETAASQQPCSCGEPARYGGKRAKKLVTLLGPVVVERAYYHCSRCGGGFAPRDRELAVEATQYSPGVRRMTALVGSETSFDRGRVLLDELAGVEVTAKAVEREAEAIGEDIAALEQVEIQRAVQLELPEIRAPEIPILYLEMDGTGVPTTAAETRGRKGKGGGAAWIWNLAHQYFPGAIEIVDLFHAREHLWELAAKLYPSDESWRHGWVRRMRKKLDAGRIEQLPASLRAIETDDAELAHQVALQADYFARNAERMRYGEFRRQGLFVGSGVIEAGCRTVIASRLKRSGMFWSLRGANAIIALRCSRLSNHFDDYWENRTKAV